MSYIHKMFSSHKKNCEGYFYVASQEHHMMRNYTGYTAALNLIDCTHYVLIDSVPPNKLFSQGNMSLVIIRTEIKEFKVKKKLMRIPMSRKYFLYFLCGSMKFNIHIFLKRWNLQANNTLITERSF